MKDRITKAELARRLGVNQSTVTKWIKKKIIRVGRDGKIDFEKAREQLEQRLDPSKKRKAQEYAGKDQGSKTEEEALAFDYYLEKAKSERFKALLLEIEYREKSGKVIDLETASKLWERVIMACRSRLLAIPSKTAPELLACRGLAEIKEILERNVHQALSELASLDPADYCRGLTVEALLSSAETDGEPVGGSKKDAQSGGKRGARAMVHGEG